MKSETAKGAEGSSSPAKPMITPAEPVGAAASGAPSRVRAKPVTPRPSRVYAVELPSFEGPLDLLLHLVRRHELDILDIPIAFVTEKYLEYLSIMRALDIEILGDYLVMAATLAYLKSRELVPQQAADEEGSEEDDEDGEDPREALIRRLIEYERFRAAGRELNEMPVIGRDVFARGGSIDLPPLDPGMAPVTLFRLTEAYSRVLQRAQINKSHEVQLERVTVRQRMEQLSLLLEERESVDFESLFLEQEWGSVEELRQMLVVTLMSVLELVKLGIIGVRQMHDTESIHLQKRASYAQAMKALTSYSEDDSFGDGSGEAGGGTPVTPEVEAPGQSASEASQGPEMTAEVDASPAAVDVPGSIVDREPEVGSGASPSTLREVREPAAGEAPADVGGVPSTLRDEREPAVGEAPAESTLGEASEPAVGEAPDDVGGVPSTLRDEREPAVGETLAAGEAPAESTLGEASEPAVGEAPDDVGGVPSTLREEREPAVGVGETLVAGEAPAESTLGEASEPAERSPASASRVEGSRDDPSAAEARRTQEGEDSPASAPVAGARGDMTQDALGEMLARVRRLEAEEEQGSPSSGVERRGAGRDVSGEDQRDPLAGDDGPGAEPRRGQEERGSSPPRSPEAEGAAPERALGDPAEGEVGTSFIDAVDDPGESHE